MFAFFYAKIHLMENIEIFKTQDGSIGLFNKDLNEIYHSKEGAQKESIEKFIIPSDFENRTKNSKIIKVLDICYGIGYNSKNALSFYKNCDIKIDAIEIDEKLIKMSFELDFYMKEINEFLRGEKKLNNCEINFFIDDARKVVQKLNEPYDVIFLDAFAPNKQPVLWSVEFFRELKRLLKPDGILTTYCSAQPVRCAMATCGFNIGKVLDNLNHSCATVCALDKNLIKLPLDEYDIGLMKTKAGICYHDENLNKSAQEIFELREKEVQSSDLIGASAYKKMFAKKND